MRLAKRGTSHRLLVRERVARGECVEHRANDMRLLPHGLEIGERGAGFEDVEHGILGARKPVLRQIDECLR